MNTPPDLPSPAALLREVDTRMAQALDNFFQRSRAAIQDTILHAIAEQIMPSVLATGQTCLDWINAYPDKLSAAFADQFRQHLAHPEMFAQTMGAQPAELQLVEDATLVRQLAEDKAAAQLAEALAPEMLLLYGRLLPLSQDTPDNPDHTRSYGPLSVVRALSRALDALDIDTRSGTFLMQCAAAPLRDMLRHTYAALNQYLSEQGVKEHTTVRAAPTPRRTESAIGQAILAHIRSIAEQAPAPLPAGVLAPAGTAAFAGIAAPAGIASLPAPPPRFIDSLTHWQASLPRILDAAPGAPALVLRQLQQDARRTDAGSFDLAVLDAVAGLFEFILDDPDVSPRYKSAIAQLEIPTLRAALVSPEFFSDDHHPARQLIDLLGLFSRRFPERNPSHTDALAQVETACTLILDDPGHKIEIFAQARNTLGAWLVEENARAETDLASEVAHLEQIERQELGTLLALENLQDLTARYPAPESVLRRLEAAWVPHMASLYVAEAGEGPDWRAACTTLLQLFLSLQAPENDAGRETRLQSIPHINAELRRGLLAQGAEPAQLKDFFGAITATQECWVRPDVGRSEAMVSTFVPRHVSREEIESLAHQLADTPPDDPILHQAQQLLEGDWVDFDPPFEGLATARVAWVGVHGYLLFCDSEEEQRFSLDCEQLAAEIRAGRAHIPEQSLTRKAMLRLKTQLLDSPA
ncbi:MAG: DUF1631 family protein [Thiobacillus sp.]